MCLTVMQLSLFAKDESRTDTTEKGEFCCLNSVWQNRCQVVPSVIVLLSCWTATDVQPQALHALCLLTIDVAVFHIR